jgi:GrpB protein
VSSPCGLSVGHSAGDSRTGQAFGPRAASTSSSDDTQQRQLADFTFFERELRADFVIERATGYRLGVALTDDEIRAATVGDLTEHNATIELAEYDGEWPRLFEREATRIRAALGPKAIQVEHVGSTSVPGLAAKPLIDIVLVVADSSDEDAYVPELKSAGYTLRI